MQFYGSDLKNIRMQNYRNFLLALLVLISHQGLAQIILETPRVDARLYLGKGKDQPLVVGLGGSEGGNAWTSDYWKKTRDRFIEKGYAFLAIGYFGAEGTPRVLEKIALEDVHYAISTAAENEMINGRKIAIVGGSRGADLALLLGSYYEDITCVAGIVASHVVFPGNTDHLGTSSWTYQNRELPFVPVNEEAVPFLIKRDLRGTFEAMLQDSSAAEKAAIQVENIKGPVLILSATRDEICPSTPMAGEIEERLKKNNFKYHFEHIAIEGGHTEPLKHFDVIFQFLEAHFLKK